jgi:hypothetical protein
MKIFMTLTLFSIMITYVFEYIPKDVQDILKLNLVNL